MIMKKLKNLLLLLSTTFVLANCGAPKYANISNIPDLSGYRYIYITPSSELSSSAGSAVGTPYGLFGSTVSKSVSPSDLIAGMFMKRGFVRLPEIKDDLKSRTIIINYGESGRTNRAFGYSTEVTLQLLNAQTLELICTSTAEGMGETESDDIKKATIKCVNAIFE